MDFGTEFQGGLRLRVSDGTLNTTVTWAAGEEANAKANGGWTLSNTWRAGGTMTLRDGPQTLEMHKHLPIADTPSCVDYINIIRACFLEFLN